MTTVLASAQWRAMAATHKASVEAITWDVRARKTAGQRHPIDDFMWTYYSQRPTQFMRWHPGAGFQLEDAAEYESERGYVVTDGTAAVSAEFLTHRRESLQWMLDLQTSLISREPRFGCFGLHEWAMVYKLEQSEVRHEQAPLRLPRERIAEIVEAQELKCTHYDAFRFYVPAARSLNHMMLVREDQLLNEQPGCLHANMDLYKWCYKATPVISSDLMLRCFYLARDIRTLDMQAAPYDLTEWDLPPVKIETTEGRAEYVRQQREFHQRATVLREEFIQQISAALEEHRAD
jgi:hypothetical protein